ncbi:hypothetical protein L596_027863 [Steinernema carpocapsae]|uniref:Uncharacterized protein n=1 Tax=Steinernema carpocapsae TaxID=34508 RepID=A0A4V5ZXQ2_STECR|nr:hypothetical protein L596_027863 [Steinernema carpocapsae]
MLPHQFPSPESKLSAICFRHAEQGNLAALKFAVRELRTSLDAKCEENGLTMLHYAVKGNATDVVRWLLSSGASIYEVCHKRQSPLHIAARENSVKSARLILQSLLQAVHPRGPSWNPCCSIEPDGDHPGEEKLAPLLCKDIDGNSPLHVAFEQSSADCAKLYLKYLFRMISCPNRLVDVIQMTNADFHTLFHVAVASRASLCCQIILEVDKLYETSMRFAKWKKINASILKQAVMDTTTWADSLGRTAAFLLATSRCACLEEPRDGADMEDSFLTQCCRMCRKEGYGMVRLLHKHCPTIFTMRDRSSGKSPFMVAANCGNLAVMQALYDLTGANIEDSDCHGRTSLHAAAAKGIDVVVDYLLNQVGASASVMDGDGYTPMHYAAISDRVGCIEKLHRANPQLLEVPSMSGHNAIMLAVMNYKLNALRVILHLHPSMNRCEVDYYGNTVAMLAARLDFTDAFMILSNFGFNVDKRTDDGFSIMQTAVRHNSIGILSMEHETVDLNQVDEKGATLLHVAAQHNHSLPALKFLLLQNQFKGRLIDRQDRYLRTPLHIAVQHEAIDCVEVLCRNGADVKIPDVVGYDPFMCAVDSNVLALYSVVLKYGINVNGYSIQRGLTTYDIAVHHGNEVMANYLRWYGALPFEKMQDRAARRIQRWMRAKLKKPPKNIKSPKKTKPIEAPLVRRTSNVFELIRLFEKHSPPRP